MRNQISEVSIRKVNIIGWTQVQTDLDGVCCIDNNNKKRLLKDDGSSTITIYL